MLLLILLLTPLVGTILIATDILKEIFENAYLNINRIKYIGLAASLINLFVCLITFIFYDFSNNQFQFVSENYDISGYDLFFGVDGLSIYFVILTAIIIPVSILSN
jgi:NADH:ubiquinone oxidoreductase subunit 4 (subunit M)